MPSVPPSPPAALAARAAFAGLAIFACEQLVFWSGYGARLVDGPGAAVAFVSTCLAYAVVSSLAAWLLALGVSRLHRRLHGRRWARAPRPARWVATTACALLGAGISVAQDGKLLSLPPVGSVAVWLAPAALVHAAWRLCGNRRPASEGAARAVALLIALLASAAYLADYELLRLFQTAAFGLSDTTAMLRGAIVLGVVALLLGGASLGRALVTPGDAEGRALRAAQWLGILALQWADQRLFVDLHLPVHGALWCLQWLWAFRLAPVWLPLDRALARAALGAAAVAALAFIATLPLESDARYLVAQHTGASRQALELDYGYLRHPGRRVAFVRGMIGRARHLAAKTMPADPRPLPSTFRPVRPSPDAPDFAAAPNLVVFMLDMKRDRDIGAHGGSPSRTPNIDACFAGGVRFTQARSNSTRTLAVFPAIYSGTHAGTRGVARPDLTVQPRWLSEAAGGKHNLIGALQAGGYDVRVLTNSYYLRFFEGETERATMGRADTLVSVDDLPDYNAALSRALREHPALIGGDGPFALFVHLMSHPLSELGQVDAVVGEVCAALERRGLSDSTARMLTSDHGVQFGEHGRVTYGRTLFDEELHVPLLWWVPGVAGREVDTPVSAVDHLATIIDLLDLPVSFETEGRSYVPELMGGAQRNAVPLYFEVRRHTTPATGVLFQGAKLAHWPRTDTYAMFDLASDPAERRNLADAPQQRERFETLRALVHRFQRERGERPWVEPVGRDGAASDPPARAPERAALP